MPLTPFANLLRSRYASVTPSTVQAPLWNALLDIAALLDEQCLDSLSVIVTNHDSAVASIETKLLAILDECSNLFGDFETVETKLEDLRSFLFSSYSASYRHQVDENLYIGKTVIVPSTSVTFTYGNKGTWPMLTFPFGKFRSACRNAFGIAEEGQAGFVRNL
jgi:hypothetical protein